jgi:type 1 fimbriae regulatory protein FimB
MDTRLYLTYGEVKAIFQAAAAGGNEIRDRCMILMCFIHGLRVSELTGIKITDVDLSSGSIYIRRLKGGFNTVHPLIQRELSLLDEWLSIRCNYDKNNSDYLFLSNKGQRMTRQQFYKLLRAYGEAAGLRLIVHPHMLRHSCGYELAEQGLDTRLIQDYLGHKNIRHTVHYTASNARRFVNVWRLTSVPITSHENKMPFSLWE